MNVTTRLLSTLALSAALGTIVHPAPAADAGLVTKPSKYSVSETLDRFEAAVKARAAAGFKVFTRIDHAAAAKEAGLEMRPRTVIVFGNPKLGTPVMVKTPLLAIDVPPKALVWEDDQARSGCRTIPPNISTRLSIRDTASPARGRSRRSERPWMR